MRASSEGCLIALRSRCLKTNRGGQKNRKKVEQLIERVPDVLTVSRAIGADLPRCKDCEGLLGSLVVDFGGTLYPDSLKVAQIAAAAASVQPSIAVRGTPGAEVNVEPTPTTSSGARAPHNHWNYHAVRIIALQIVVAKTT
ncbi:hypothetical protein TcWFU_004159 [Taenia crassiceps]|uniref:Uncharacterized protein n=1 Tax=Taenia crassiceps TaxID=6207 RepID=A0ABR4QQR8_9CEST